jgi:hypothetical protein
VDTSTHHPSGEKQAWTHISNVQLVYATDSGSSSSLVLYPSSVGKSFFSWTLQFILIDFQELSQGPEYGFWVDLFVEDVGCLCACVLVNSSFASIGSIF